VGSNPTPPTLEITSKPGVDAVIRQALRVYQLYDMNIKAGNRMAFIDRNDHAIPDGPPKMSEMLDNHPKLRKWLDIHYPLPKD
tara:strand:- start:393 stop:641 length:249 start_codon:yes stop_codon:yes gene_type:complete